MVKIRLITPRPEHAELILAYRQDPVTERHNPLNQPSSIEWILERFSRNSHDWNEFETADGFSWIAELNGKAVGTTSVQNLNHQMLTAEIGYGVFSEYRGRGIATEIVNRLVNNTFENTPLRKLTALVHEENTASRRVMEKVGFKQEGLLREHFLIQGKPVNEVFYGLLRRELNKE